MTTVYLNTLESSSALKAGYMNLYGSTGIRYRNRAIEVPGYGWVPCSRKLQSNFSTNPSELMLVISEPTDNERPVTSDIWITRSNVVATF